MRKEATALSRAKVLRPILEIEEQGFPVSCALEDAAHDLGLSKSHTWRLYRRMKANDARSSALGFAAGVARKRAPVDCLEKLNRSLNAALHIPGYPPTYSDNIRPFVPGYPPPALTRCREALVFDISFLAFRHVVEGLSFGRFVRRVRAGRRCAPAGRGWHLRRWVHQ